MGHCVMENRNGRVVASEVTQASGIAEPDAALRMARSTKGAHQKTLGADKAGPISKVVRSGRCSETPRLRLQRSVIAEH